MFVWTKKAEEAYRAKYPHRKNERKAGTMVTWEGKELHAGTILDGYASRGWVDEVEPEPVIVEPVKSTPKKKIHTLPNTEKRKRWYKLAYYFNQPAPMSLEEIAKQMGYRSHHTLSDLVKNYGEEMVKKYGKLPYREGMKAPYWRKVMEDE